MELIGPLVPENGFIHEYLKTIKEFIDAPHIYHLVSALVILGAAMGRNVWVPFGRKKIYPNLYFCLLGPTGRFRKSECIEAVRAILQAYDDGLIVPDEFSMEWLVERLNKKPDGIFLWPEFSAQISYFERHYMSGAKEMFTRFYDCPTDYKRALKSGEVKIDQVIPSVLAGSTKEWLFGNMKEADLLGGFFGRFLYVIPDKSEKFIPRPPYVGEEWIRTCMPYLDQLREVKGEVDLGSTGALYDEFAVRIHNDMERTSDGGLREAFHTRIPTSVLKFALTYHFSMSQSRTMSNEAMTRAITLGDFLKNTLDNALQNDLALTPEMRNKLKVLKMIQGNFGILHNKLLQNSNLTATVLRAILEQLTEEERIYYKGTGVKGNPKRYFAR